MSSIPCLAFVCVQGGGGSAFVCRVVGAPVFQSTHGKTLILENHSLLIVNYP